MTTIKQYFFSFILLVICNIATLIAYQAKGEVINAVEHHYKNSNIGALGTIDPHSRVIDITPDISMDALKIKRLFVKEGQHIKRGDVIASFSNEDRNQLKVKIAELQVKQTMLSVEKERINIESLQKDLTRLKGLRIGSAISQTSVDEAEKNYNLSTINIKSLETQLYNAQTNLELAKAELEQSYVAAPLDCTVLYINVQEGERVDNKGVARVADLSVMDIVAEIYEGDMPRIKLGQRAEITIPGFQQKFKAVVSELGYVVQKNDLNDTDPLANKDNRIIEVRLKLDNDNIEVLQHLIHMQVYVKIFV